jgi:hypothetical protein
MIGVQVATQSGVTGRFALAGDYKFTRSSQTLSVTAAKHAARLIPITPCVVRRGTSDDRKPRRHLPYDARA